MDAKTKRLFDAADIAYSEMAFAVHDIAGRRLTSAALMDRRAQRLAKAADELHAALKAIDGRRE